jgi:hypothetical protein
MQRLSQTSGGRKGRAPHPVTLTEWQPRARRGSARELDIATQLGNARGEFCSGDPHMERNENEHPEQSYRRGFQQGSGEVFHALERAGLLDERTLRVLRDFVYGPVARWRFNSRRRLKRHRLHDAAPTLAGKINRRAQ